MEEKEAADAPGCGAAGIVGCCARRERSCAWSEMRRASRRRTARAVLDWEGDGEGFEILPLASTLALTAEAGSSDGVGEGDIWALVRVVWELCCGLQLKLRW